MKERMLLVIANTDELNQPAVTTAFQGYEHREWINGAWLVKTDVAPQEFLGKIRGAFGGTNDIAIFPVDQTILQGSVLPAELRQYVGLKAVA